MDGKNATNLFINITGDDASYNMTFLPHNKYRETILTLSFFCLTLC